MQKITLFKPDKPTQIKVSMDKLKYEYSQFCHGMEFNLDHYLGLRYKDEMV